MDNYLSDLNPQQRAAVEYCDGPQLVIAGAGSGKTRVLTYKIVHLLANGYEPWRILALTFTNKAAREMRDRINALVGEKTANRLWMGTFHSIFAKLIRRDAERIGYKSSFTIYDTKDSLALIKSIVKEMKLDDKAYKPSLIQEIISKAKNSLVSAERYALTKEYVDYDIKCGRPLISEIYRIYVQRCRVAGAMDFDDLLYYTNVLIRDNDDILHYYQEFFRYVLVDEYQDTNFAQHMIINQLSKGNNHICVVGDDAQSIYSFRGANIRNILNLERIFPELKTFKLEQNYRSTQNIINAANSLIEKNADQIKKHIFSENAAGELVEVMKSYSDFEEAYKVVADISRRHLYDHQSFDNFAILYRTNAQSRVLEQALSSGGLRDTHGNKRKGIPYRIYGGTSFYQRKEIKDAIAYFRLSLNPDDDEALRRIINYPARGIGDTTLAKLNSAAVANNVSIWRVISELDSFEINVNSGTKARLAAFRELIANFIRMNLAGNDAETMAREIIQSTNLLGVLKSENTPENISKQENLEELLSGTGQFVSDQKETGNENSIGLADYLADVSLATDLDDPEKENADDCVTLMTIHAAKGLEFTNVYIVGAEEDLFPSAMSKDSAAEIEEERRLMYMAITRAKKSCMIPYAESRYRNGQTTFSRPSRFITDIDPQFLNFNLGGKRASTPTPSRKPTIKPPFGDPRISGPSRPFTPFSPPHITPLKPAAMAGGYALHTASELTIGMRIEHARFGEGTVTAIDTSGFDEAIRVKFDNLDEKKLLLKYAKFNIL
ncbi:MAG: UvrD-helicase domain-containing protein [Muribaculaceae bacterium]|nr:UvrD-helicase domain-containing protein [Muribaculaceae bacterium]